MSFSSDIKAFSKKAQANMDRAVQGVATTLVRNVVMTTPLGTPDFITEWAWAGYPGPGRAIKNWQVSLTSSPTGEILAQQPNRAVHIAELSAITKNAKAGGVVYIANNARYIEILEYGKFPWANTQKGRVKNYMSTQVPSSGGFARSAYQVLLSRLDQIILDSVKGV